MFSSKNIMRGRGLLVVAIVSYVMKAVMGEEEKPPSSVDVSIAATLLGAISFIMCLYYFINNKDEDIQQKSWETISSTISIFCAVLLWSTINDMMEAYVIEPTFGEEGQPNYNEMGALTVDIVHMLIWFVIMQVALACLSGAAGPGQIEPEEFEKMSKDDQEELLEKKEVDLKCFAVLLAHITGFSAINAFGMVQQVFFSSSVPAAFMTVPVALAVMIVLQRITDTIRERVMLGDDGEKDQFETKWDDEVEEAENDVMGLALSFTCISAMRFAISGCLPNQEGKEEGCKVNGVEDKAFLFHHSTFEQVALMGAGLAFTALLFFCKKNFPEWAETANGLPAVTVEEKAYRHKTRIQARTLEGVICSISMCLSWSFFFGGQMILAGTGFNERQAEMMSVLLALVLSFICMFGLFPLDALADAECTGEAVDGAIRSIMSAMSLLIGFSWEQCFDTSVDTLAKESDTSSIGFVNPHTCKLFLTIFCASLLVPAWKWYMLPFIINQGWRYGYVLQIKDVGKYAKILMKENHEEKSDDEGETQTEVNEEKFLKVVEVFKDVHEHGLKRAKKSTSGGESKPRLDIAGYQALPGDDIEALRRKNATLTEELKKARDASGKAQQMLDGTMESMMSAMKHMHMTVGRIEQSA